MSKSEPILDPAAHEAIRAIGQAALLARVIALYRREAPMLLSALRRAGATSDAEALCRAAHTLKSSSRGLGGMRLAAVCAECEARVRAGKLAEAAALAERIAGELTAFEEALSSPAAAAAAVA